MKIRICDWDIHFERDRTKQWKHLSWVPIPNKQGSGYRRIMKEKDGVQIYGCWVALLAQASLCTPRGDLTKYDLADLANLTLINEHVLIRSIKYLSDVLDWVEVVNLDNMNLDINVKNIDNHEIPNCGGSSVLFSSIQFNSCINSGEMQEGVKKIWRDDFNIYQAECDSSYQTVRANELWVLEREKYHPGLDVRLSLEKSWRDYWRTEAGWTQKKKDRKSKTIGWLATWQNALTMRCNQVWKPREDHAKEMSRKSLRERLADVKFAE